jgi:hypothetical protein
MPQRGGKLVRGAATIKGLRFENDVRERITAYAEEMAAAHQTEVNLAAAVRDLVRRGLGATRGRHSCDYEAYLQALGEARRRIAEAAQG